MDSLYICYQSIFEPLSHSQVLAYLEGLGRAGYRLGLLTFEPRRLTHAETGEWRQRLAARGVDWHWLPYHKRPTAPATSWDIAAGVAKGLTLIREHGIRLIHARAHVPGVMGWILKKLTGVKLLLDIRGFMAEEYVDAGNWPAGGLLFRSTKRVERKLVQAADAIVVLTRSARALLGEWYPREIAGKPIAVIPCCVSLRGAAPATSETQSQAKGNAVRLVYAGKLGGWYPTGEMVAFFAAARRVLPDLRWDIWTQSDPGEARRLLGARGLLDQVQIGRIAPELLLGELVKARAGLCLYQRSLSRAACSPTKVAEYLAAGLPVVCTAGIGDVDELLAGGGSGNGPVGVIVREQTAEGYRDAASRLAALLSDPEVGERCRRVAEEKLDLERVGWPRYRQIYDDLLAKERRRRPIRRSVVSSAALQPLGSGR